MKYLKNGLSIRGDLYYCPLSFQLDTYWNCENACLHCYLRRLNRTWGEELRPLDLDEFRKKIKNGLKNKNPSTPLAWAIANKKTIRLGNKADPYQPAEIIYKVTRGAVRLLVKLDWSFVIQTMYTKNVWRDIDILRRKKELVTIMPIISPGLEKDWEILEKKGTTNPINRLIDARNFQREGFNVGINGEPFIAGFHTIDDFRHMMEILKEWEIKSYNTYYLHMNDWNLKKLHEAGLDIEKIWRMNQDDHWRPILREMIDIAKDYGIILGCPDFVNSGSYQETANTCCGVSVSNPCTFNVINWKKMKAEGMDDEEIIEKSFDGVGDKEFGMRILQGKETDLFTLKDIKY